MRPWVALLALALLPVASAQTVRDGGNLVILIHHPYPDAADPLGFPYTQGGFNGSGYYQQRYAGFDKEKDGFSYPHLAVDGVLAVEGLPDPSRPYQSTMAAYQAALAQRLTEQAAVRLEVRTQWAGDQLLVVAQVTPNGAIPGEALEAWMALVEDNVAYTAPPAVSNGVNNHRFTVRSISNEGPLDLADGAPRQLTATLQADPAWQRGQLSLALWVQAGASFGSRFDANEVVQATLHPLQGDVVTRQDTKAVLMEALSATWCQTCIYGDKVLEDLAQEHGYAATPKPAAAGYWRAPPSPIAAVAALGAAALLAAPRLRKGAP